MTNKFVEGFGIYGTRANSTAAQIQAAMQSGVWASVDSSSGSGGITTLPWDVSNTDLYLIGDGYTGSRVAIPGGVIDPCRVSMYYGVPSLPSAGHDYPVIFGDVSNATIAYLSLGTTGTLTLLDGSDNVLVVTDGPVIVASSAVHLEMELNRSAGTFKLYIQGTIVLDASGLTFTGTGGCAQITFMHSEFGGSVTQYMAHLVVRNSSGTYNNSFPIGDRRTATLLANADDLAHQGWTAHPRKLYAVGLEDNRSANNTGVTAANSSQTDLGSGDYTLEGFYRITTMPSGSNKAALFGKWDETNNKRSYQIYIGGASLESGNTVFRISTDGSAVTELYSYPAVWETNRWYHIAVCRASAVTRLFMDGIELSTSVADSNTYYAGTETTALGVQDDSGAQIANTAFTGFIGQFRLTVGFARYTSNFTRPAAEFGIGSGNDAHWSSVQWVSNWDTGLFDQSASARTLTAKNGAVFFTPNDGVSNYQCIGKSSPTGADDQCVEAPLYAATGLLTQTALPTTTDTVTVGTYSSGGSHAAVYTWKTSLSGAAFEVKIGASVAASLANLMNAIITGPGSGSTYGTGTIVNASVTASQPDNAQLLATALVQGAAGNSIASTTTDPSGSWTGTTLSGGADIPAYSSFYVQRPPTNMTIVDSITLYNRSLKSDSGSCTMQASLVGAGGAAAAGGTNAVTTTPIYYMDTFEVDPDTSNGVTPTTVIGGRIKLNRTA